MNSPDPSTSVNARLADVIEALPRRDPIRPLLVELCEQFRTSARLVAVLPFPLEARRIMCDELRAVLLSQLTRLLVYAAGLCEEADQEERDRREAADRDQALWSAADDVFHAGRYGTVERLREGQP